MQEVFEKIIEEIKEKSYEIQLDGAIVAATKKVAEVPDIVNIVNTISEEYNNGWIPCSERLPEESLQSVMGWDEYRERICFVHFIRGRFILGDDTDSVNIIAWQPLPAPYQLHQREEKE